MCKSHKTAIFFKKKVTIKIKQKYLYIATEINTSQLGVQNELLRRQNLTINSSLRTARKTLSKHPSFMT